MFEDDTAALSSTRPPSPCFSSSWISFFATASSNGPLTASWRLFAPLALTNQVSLDKPAYPRDSRNRPLYRAASRIRPTKKAPRRGDAENGLRAPSGGGKSRRKGRSGSDGVSSLFSTGALPLSFRAPTGGVMSSYSMVSAISSSTASFICSTCLESSNPRRKSIWARCSASSTTLS